MMAEYSYTAIDAKGNKQKGTLQAVSLRAVKAELRNRAYTPITIKMRSLEKPLLKWLPRERKIPSKQLTLFTRELATLVQANIPVAEALATMALQCDKPRLKNVINAVRDKVCEGYGLADALALFPQYFDELYCATVRSGEAAGHLSLVLESLAEYLERQHGIRQKVLQALVYPSIVSVVAIAIVIFLLTNVVPQIMQVFTDTEQELPAITVMLLSMSNFMREYGLLLGVIFLLGFLSLRIAMRQTHIKMRWHACILKLPIIKRLSMTANIGRFSQTLAVLLQSGVPAHEAAVIATALIKNKVMQARFCLATKNIREGKPLSAALKATGYVEPVTLQLISSGENSGNLHQAFVRAGKQQQQSLEYFIDTSLIVFEPMMILIMGGVVLFIVMAILLPIFTLEQIPL